MGYCSVTKNFDKGRRGSKKSRDGNTMPQKMKMVCYQIESDVDEQVTGKVDFISIHLLPPLMLSSTGSQVHQLLHARALRLL